MAFLLKETSIAERNFKLWEIELRQKQPSWAVQQQPSWAIHFLKFPKETPVVEILF